MPFSTVVQVARPPKLTAVVGTTWVNVATTAAEAESFAWMLNTTERSKVEAVKLASHFLIGVTIVRRSSGYGVTIKRVTLQQAPRAKRQFCIVAKIDRPGPGEAVTIEPFVAQHVVTLSSRRFRIDQFHWAIPQAFVLRNTKDMLLAASKDGSGPDRKNSGNASICHA
ncbi:MAG: hypothetical protein WAQ33_05435 [Gaiellaceae bacterium]